MVTITAVEEVEFELEFEDVGRDDHGFNLVYEPGSTLERTDTLLRIHTDEGITGECLGGTSERIANYLLGRDPLRRERHWAEIRRATRHSTGKALGRADVALWDIAGKHAGLPIHELLGTYRDRLPAYASTPHGDTNDGLDSPAAYAAFAERCRDRGYPAFKIHGWGGSDAARDIDREVATVHAVGDAVGDDMDLMLDPACEYRTWRDALAVGRACDTQEFLWYEDPFHDCGRSQHAHRTLREHLDTPLLQGEHIYGLEPHLDWAASGATDFVRGGMAHGITGLMKVARAAEGLGLDVEIHGPRPAKRHCMAAIRNTNYYEMGLVHPEWHHALQPDVAYVDYADRLDAVDANGTVPVPDDPGLGVEFDRDYIAANETERTRYE
jgi:L-alanine-DL-glutamate epimerase-like enolase superfamily enzyme